MSTRRLAARLAAALLVALSLSGGPALAGQAPTVGDEGLEPRERRVEATLGSESLNLVYRHGYARRTGGSGTLSVQTNWRGGFTALGAGATYRLFGGYPLRLILRADLQLGLGPAHGPSLGGRFVPGVAAEVGREGRISAAVGLSAPLTAFVLPERSFERAAALDGVLSAPVRDRWRASVGLIVTQHTQAGEVGWPTYTVNAFIGLARWL